MDTTAFWWPPMWPRAASTSKASRTSRPTIFRRCPKTSSIAWDAPDGWAPGVRRRPSARGVSVRKWRALSVLSPSSASPAPSPRIFRKRPAGKPLRSSSCRRPPGRNNAPNRSGVSRRSSAAAAQSKRSRTGLLARPPGLEFGHFQAAAPHGWGMLQLAKRAWLAQDRPGGLSYVQFCLLHRNGHTLLAGDASESNHDGLVAGRDIGRDHHIQLHDAGDESGGLPGEGPVGRLATDGDGGLQ